MEIIDILKDVQKDMQIVLVDDKGQLTFMGCMLLASIHFSVIQILGGMIKNENQQNKTN